MGQCHFMYFLVKVTVVTGRGARKPFFDAALRHVYEGKSRTGYIWSGLCCVSAEYSRKLHKMIMSVSAQVFKSTD